MFYISLIKKFFINEIKEILLSVKKKLFTFKDINFIKFFLNKINNNNNINFFNNNYLNKYLNLNYKLNYSKTSLKRNSPILVEGFITHPEYLTLNLIIAKKISEIKNTEIIGILYKGDFRSKKIFNSYGINKFFYLDNGNFFKRLFFLFRAIQILKKIKNIETLLKLKFDKIHVGKCIYEQYLRYQKRPYVQNILPIFYIYLTKLLIHDSQFKKIYSKYKGSYLVQSETQYFPLRVSMQRALINQIKVISRSGRKNIGIKIYRKVSEGYENRNKISNDIFRKILFRLNKKYKGNNFKKFIKRKTNINIGRDVYQYSKNKTPLKLFKNKYELSKYFNFANKPIILILAHEYTDGNLANSWNLYNNDMFWLEDTLDKIKTIDNVNWIIKSHPSEKIYNAKINTKKIFLSKITDQKHIGLFPENYDVVNIHKYIKAAISSHGTAGYEYPLYSIPTIICGDTNYSGLGFNYEPRTKKEYYKLLRNINKLKKNNLIKTYKSWIFNLIFNYVRREKIPFINETMSIKSSFDQKKFWKVYFDELHKNKNNYQLNNFKKSLTFNLINKEKIFINLKRLTEVTKNK